MYLKQIEQLVALQRIDSEILQLDRELEVAPKEVLALEEQFNVLDEQRNQYLEKIKYNKDS